MLAWPAQGDWLPGAIEALHKLKKHGDVLIYSCRTNPRQPDWHGGGMRPDGETFASICEMRQMLDDADLEDVELYLKPGKPPGAIYIDDRAYRFTDWEVDIDNILSAVRGA